VSLTLFAIHFTFQLIPRASSASADSSHPCTFGTFRGTPRNPVPRIGVVNGSGDAPGLGAGLGANGKLGRMVCLKTGKMTAVSLDEALEKMKFIGLCSEIVEAARAVGANLGDSA
jgi:hypothetical protein